MTKKILIAAGGTGGHIYPALGLARQLRKEDPSIDILFTAGGLSNNKFFDKNEFPYHSINSGTFSKKSLFQILQSCKNIFSGFSQSRRILQDYAPDLVIGFGSYHTLPVLLAAQWSNVPIVLHEQNSKPGKVIRFFSKKALMTGVYFPSASAHLQGKTVELAMPLREGFAYDCASKENARTHFDLDPDRCTLLVFGGSQGAQFINRIVSETASKLALRCDFQILHFTGDTTQTVKIKEIYRKAGIRSCVKDFEQRMDLAWKAADIMISRSGAGTIAEQMEFEVPGILIPYPHAADDHQDSNADYVVNEVKGGWKFREKDLERNDFSGILAPLLGKGCNELKEKRESLSHYKKKKNQKEFSSVIRVLLDSLQCKKAG